MNTQTLFMCDIPKGIHVLRFEDKAEAFREVKKHWKTVQRLIEDVEIPDDVKDGDDLIKFFDACWVDPEMTYVRGDIYNRNDLIEAEII